MTQLVEGMHIMMKAQLQQQTTAFGLFQRWVERSITFKDLSKAASTTTLNTVMETESVPESRDRRRNRRSHSTTSQLCMIRFQRTEPCPRCGGKHTYGECPQRTNSRSDVVPIVINFQADPDTVILPGQLFMYGPIGKSYLEITYRGRKTEALLDSGADLSIAGRRFLQEEILPTEHHVKTADGTHMPILGESVIHFTVSGMPLQANVIVTGATEEFILGTAWMTANKCDWLFGRNEFFIDGRPVKLTRGARKERQFRGLIRSPDRSNTRPTQAEGTNRRNNKNQPPTPYAEGSVGDHRF